MGKLTHDRPKALVEFLSKFGHVIVGEVVEERDGKNVSVTTFTRIKGTADEHNAAVRGTWEACKDTMWWTLKQENPYKGFSLNDALKAVIKQAKAAQAKAADGAENVSLDDVNDSVIQEVLALCKFEAIIGADNDEENVQAQVA